MNFIMCNGSAMPVHISRREEIEFRTRVILKSVGGHKPEPVHEPRAISSRTSGKMPRKSDHQTSLAIDGAMGNFI
jgi:hypothetical protein